MRILIINTKDSGGGAAEIARVLGERYTAAGHTVHWLVGTRTRHDDPRVSECPAPGDPGTVGRWGPRLLRRLGLAWRGADQARMRWRRLAQVARPASSWAQCRGREDFALFSRGGFARLLPWEPDVVHLHNLHGFNHVTHFDLRLLPEISHRWPTLVTLHDPWLTTGHCAHFIECTRWRSGCGACPRLGIYPKIRRDETARNWQTKAAIARTSRLHAVAVCKWMAGVARASLLAPALASLRVIPNGVDVKLFRPASLGEKIALRDALGLAPDAVTVVYASELGAHNPFRDFAAMQLACERLAHAVVPRRVTAIELGNPHSGDEVRGNLRVVSPGFVTRGRLVAYLRSADALLHAAIADTSPTIVYEAMACALPVIATAVCGLPEQVEEGVTGALVAPGDRHALAETLIHLARTTGQAERWGAAGRRKVEQEHDQDLMAQRYLAALSEVATGN